MPRTNKPENGSTESPKPARASKKSNGSTDSVNNPDAVARRAYEIYQRRGGNHGADIDDWLAAERELKPGTSDVTRPVPAAKPRKRKGSQDTV